MKQILFILFLLALNLVQAQNSNINLIPQVVKLEQHKGSFTLTKDASVSFNKAESRSIAEMLVQSMKGATGFTMKTAQGMKGSVQLNLNTVTDKQLGNEGYTLTSTTKGVVITANQNAGLFYGIQTQIGRAHV